MWDGVLASSSSFTYTFPSAASWQCSFIASVCDHCGATMVACVAWLQLLCGVVGAVTFSCTWFPWTAYCGSSESDAFLIKCGYLDCEFPFGDYHSLMKSCFIGVWVESI